MYVFIYNILIIIIFLIGITVLFKRKDLNKTVKVSLFPLIIYFIFYYSYFFLFTFATFSFFSKIIALFFWNLSIIVKMFFNIAWSSTFVLELHKNSRIKYFPLLFLLVFSGIIISLIFIPETFFVYSRGQDYYYVFNNILLFDAITLINILMVLILNGSQIAGISNYNDKTLSKYYSVYIIIFSINIIVYLFFLANQSQIFKHVHLIIYLLNTAFIFYIISRKPSLFVVFTNKLYNFIIFHQSGILLYSYDFEKKQELEETLLKGSILIGINHILSKFVNVEDQISMIKLEEHGIIFHFNKELGYATLLVAKHKNNLLENTLKAFNQKFAERHRDILINLRGLIDVSEFSQTIDLIKQEFKPYLS